MGVLLILASVVLGGRLVGSATQTSRWLSVTRTLAAGHVLVASDLVSVKAHLPASAGSHYFAADPTQLVGRTLGRPLSSGEFLPAEALASGSSGPSRVLPLIVKAGRLPALSTGDHVDVYVLSRPQGGGVGREIRVLTNVEYVGQDALSTGETSVVLRVAPAQAATAIAASQSGRVDVVRIDGHGQSDPSDAGPSSVPGSTVADLGPGVKESPLPVLTAVVTPAAEAALVAGFADPDLAITVVRRCVDIVELLSAAAAGTARAALVSADLRDLDREVIHRLSDGGLATVGLAANESDERLLRQLGTDLVLPAEAPPEQVAGALRAAAAALAGPTQRVEAAEVESGRGTVVAVWGPTGAPGRSTVALGLADALARSRQSTLLVDVDPYGGSLAILTGLLDESPGIAAAVRAANAGSLDVPRLAACCRGLSPELRVLTGLSQASRWPELRSTALEVVLSLSRQLAAVTVVDCGFCLEDDDELSYDTLAPRRNAATLTSLTSADRILAIGSADPVGLSRLAGELPRLAAALGEPLDGLLASGRVVVVVNRLRDGLLVGKPIGGVADALRQHIGAATFAALPMDVAAADAAHGRGRLLSEAAPDSALFLAMDELAAGLADVHRESDGARKATRRGRFGRRRRPVRVAG